MLKVTIYQQINDYTCGPAALLTAISHFQDIPSTLTEQSLLDALATSREEGTPNDKMVEVARKLGYTVETGTGGTIEHLKKQLDKGQPCIITYNDSLKSFHFSVVVDIDDEYLTLADPWFKKNLKYELTNFQKRWVDSQGTKGWWMSLSPKKFKDKLEAAYIVAEEPLPLASYIHTNIKFETGIAVTFPFARNTVSSQNWKIAKHVYQQDIEPAGMFMILDESPEDEWKPEGWIKGEMHFKNPLVLLWGNAYDDSSWKAALYRYYGKKGKALSAAIKKDGYDGIVTVNGTKGISEIVKL